MQEKRLQNRISLFTFALTILVIWVHSVNLTPQQLLDAGFTSGGAGALGSGLSVGMAGMGEEVSYEGSFLSGYSLWFHQLLLGIELFLTNNIGQIAVPGFFMVSAYLFFRNVPKEQVAMEQAPMGGELFKKKLFPTGFRAWLLGKWKSRVFSVLIPFFLWNLLYYLFHLIPSLLLSAVGVSGAEYVPVNGRAIFGALFQYSYNPVFWYLGELILLIVLAPLLYLLVRGRRAGLIVLLLSFLSAMFWPVLPVHLVNEDALFYYLLGAYAAMHKKEWIEEGRKVGLLAFVSFLLCLPALFTTFFTGSLSEILSDFLSGSLLKGGLLTCAPFLSEGIRTGTVVLFRASLPSFLFFGSFLLSKKNSRFLAFLSRERLPGFLRINFLIYATHYLVVRGLNRAALFLLSRDIFSMGSGSAGGFALAGFPESTAALFHPLTGWILILLFLLYLLLPILCVLAACVLSAFLRRFMPGALRLLSGGR